MLASEFISGIPEIDKYTAIMHGDHEPLAKEMASELRDNVIRYKIDHSSTYRFKLDEIIYNKLECDKTPTIWWDVETFDICNGYQACWGNWSHVTFDYQLYSFFYIRKNNKLFFRDDDEYHSNGLFDEYNNVNKSKYFSKHASRYYIGDILVPNNVYCLYQMSQYGWTKGKASYDYLKTYKDTSQYNRSDTQLEHRLRLINCWYRKTYLGDIIKKDVS